MLGPGLWDCGDGGCGRSWYMWSPILSLALALRLCLSFPSPHVPFLSSPLDSLSPEPLISDLGGDLHSLSYQNPQRELPPLFRQPPSSSPTVTQLSSFLGTKRLDQSNQPSPRLPVLLCTPHICLPSVSPSTHPSSGRFPTVSTHQRFGGGVWTIAPWLISVIKLWCVEGIQGSK